MLKHWTVLGYKKRHALVSEDALMLQRIKPGQADALETSAVELQNLVQWKQVEYELCLSSLRGSVHNQSSFRGRPTADFRASHFITIGHFEMYARKLEVPAACTKSSCFA